MKVHTVEDYYLNHGWLAAKNRFWQAAQHKLTEHPLAQRFLSRQQSMVLVRSRVVPNPLWKKTWLYHEVERPLGVEDLASVCQITAADQALILTCGRCRLFSDRELAPLHSFQRVLTGLAPFCVGFAQATAPTPGLSNGAHPQNPASRLTAREHETLHWVRMGKRDSEIGIILHISPRTVTTHLVSIYRKLGVETRTAAALLHSRDCRPSASSSADKYT